MDEYRLQGATKAVFDLIDDLSKWYIRRSRERFVAGDREALDTLYYVLLELTKILAPFAPFLCESVYLSIVDEPKESVHLEDFPEVNIAEIDEELLSNMEKVREVCSLGLKIRDENRLKVRQPLSEVYIPIKDMEMIEIVKGELNVKDVKYSESPKEEEGYVSLSDGKVFVSMDTRVTEELKKEGIFNEVVRGIQVARKESGCQVGQMVDINYMTESDELTDMLGSQSKEVSNMVSARSLERVEKLDDGVNIKVGEDTVVISIVK
jgi:isoleucyl-tRNA synthetase